MPQLIDEPEHRRLLEMLCSTDQNSKMHNASMEELHQQYQEQLQMLEEIIKKTQEMAAIMAKEDIVLQTTSDWIVEGVDFVSRKRSLASKQY